jgi:hypothetical protein
MPSKVVRRSIAGAAKRVSPLRRLPVLQLLTAAELVLLTREHVMRLNRQERRRLLELVRIGRGRRANLSESEREELAALISKAEPRLLVGRAVEKLSPLPVPRRLLYGRRRRD